MEGNSVILNNIPFEKGPLTTMIERLCKTMNSMDKEWSKGIKPATQNQIQSVIDILKQYGKNVPLAYLLFLQTMGMDDNGLLEHEWDGFTEINMDAALGTYREYYDDFVPYGFLPFSFHWTEAILSMELTEADNPPIYNGYAKTPFSGSFENYLFQMAFRQVENMQFLYQVRCATSKEEFRDILAEKAAQNFSWTKPMELIETLLKPYQLQKAWFSDDVRFCGISSEYLISVDLHWALNIRISSDNHTVLQNMKNSLIYLFGDALVN